jgi:hypothetical protein
MKEFLPSVIHAHSRGKKYGRILEPSSSSSAYPLCSREKEENEEEDK